MKHDGDRGIAFLLRMVTAFQTAFGAGENNFGHVSCLAVRAIVDEIAQIT